MDQESKFTDTGQPPILTVVCIENGEAFRVQHDIFALQSALLTSAAATSSSSGQPFIVIHAPAEDVRRMIAYLYHGCYSDLGNQRDIESYKVQDHEFHSSVIAWTAWLKHLLEQNEETPSRRSTQLTRGHASALLASLAPPLISASKQASYHTPTPAEPSNIESYSPPPHDDTEKLSIHTSMWHLAEIYNIPTLKLEAESKITDLLVSNPDIVLSPSFPKAAQHIWNVTRHTEGRGHHLRREVLDAILRHLPQLLTAMNSRTWNRGAEPGYFLRSLMSGMYQQYMGAVAEARGLRELIRAEREEQAKKERRIMKLLTKRMGEIDKVSKDLRVMRAGMQVATLALEREREDATAEKMRYRQAQMMLDPEAEVGREVMPMERPTMSAPRTLSTSSTPRVLSTSSALRPQLQGYQWDESQGLFITLGESGNGRATE